MVNYKINNLKFDNIHASDYVELETTFHGNGRRNISCDFLNNLSDQLFNGGMFLEMGNRFDAAQSLILFILGKIKKKDFHGVVINTFLNNFSLENDPLLSYMSKVKTLGLTEQIRILRSDKHFGCKFCLINNFKFDIVFVNDNESFLQLQNDIEMSRKLCYQGGYIVGHGFTDKNIRQDVIRIAKHYRPMSFGDVWLFKNL